MWLIKYLGKLECNNCSAITLYPECIHSSIPLKMWNLPKMLLNRHKITDTSSTFPGKPGELLDKDAGI